MMRTIVRNVVVCLMIMLAVPSFAQSKGEKSDMIVLGRELSPKDTTKQYRFTNRLIAPKGEWQCGLSVMYADINSADNDFMMLLQGVNARASVIRIAPEAAYTFRNNHAVGVRFNYTKAGGVLDTATADLLGNLSLSVNDLSATANSMGGSVFQRTYIGIDKLGRFGVIWEYILGYSRTKTQFATGDNAPAYTVKEKGYLSFAPGIVYFPMNNMSIQASISIADISYASTTAYQDSVVTGSRKGWNANASLNLLNLNFGLTIHL